MGPYEKLVDVFKITERKDGAVFKTENVGLKWVDSEAIKPQDEIWASPGSSYTEQTFRRKTNG